MRGGTGGSAAGAGAAPPAVLRAAGRRPSGQRPSGWHVEMGGSESSLHDVDCVPVLFGVAGENGERGPVCRSARDAGDTGDIGPGDMGPGEMTCTDCSPSRNRTDNRGGVDAPMLAEEAGLHGDEAPTAAQCPQASGLKAQGLQGFDGPCTLAIQGLAGLVGLLCLREDAWRRTRGDAP